jgi:hypothetical protein
MDSLVKHGAFFEVDILMHLFIPILKNGVLQGAG